MKLKYRNSHQYTRDVARLYFERVLKKHKHQDVLHHMTDGLHWEHFVSDVANEVSRYKFGCKSNRFILVYISERARAYAELFLNHLADRVGTGALVEEEIVKHP